MPTNKAPTSNEWDLPKLRASINFQVRLLLLTQRLCIIYVLARMPNDDEGGGQFADLSPKQDDWKDPVSGESIAHGTSGVSFW